MVDFGSLQFFASLYPDPGGSFLSATAFPVFAWPLYPEKQCLLLFLYTEIISFAPAFHHFIECNMANIDIHTCEKLGRALDISWLYLVGITDEKKPVTYGLTFFSCHHLVFCYPTKLCV